jgi:DNA polymerase I
MKYAILDTESTIYQKGHPFSDRNKLCLVGIRVGTTNYIYNIEFASLPYGQELERLRSLINTVDLVVGFNLKHDLNWLARYGVRLPNHVRVFDCQLAEFILSHQSTPFPSLDGCCAKYGLAGKSNVVADEYWSKGIDTTEVPLEILQPYLENDLEITDALYNRLSSLLPEGNFRSLINLHMQDLRVLQEMEFNGIQLNWAAMEQAANKTEAELNDINRQILQFVPEEARGWFNTGSNDHISALLYGGTIVGKQSTPYEHTFKTGERAGTVVTRNRWDIFSCTFPRLVDPLEGTALAKRDAEGNEAFWSTGADILRELREPAALIRLLLKQAELAKLLTTYYHGFPATAAKMDWQDGKLHSNLNQCVVVTGRLSSSRPNQQNMPKDMNEFLQSRF